MRKGKGLGMHNECCMPDWAIIILIVFGLLFFIVCAFIGLSEVVQFFVRMK